MLGTAIQYTIHKQVDACTHCSFSTRWLLWFISVTHCRTRYCPIRGEKICPLPMAVQWSAVHAAHTTRDWPINAIIIYPEGGGVIYMGTSTAPALPLMGRHFVLHILICCHCQLTIILSFRFSASSKTLHQSKLGFLANNWLTEIMLNVPLDTKQVILETLYPANLIASTEKKTDK